MDKRYMAALCIAIVAVLSGCGADTPTATPVAPSTATVVVMPTNTVGVSVPTVAGIATSTTPPDMPAATDTVPVSTATIALTPTETSAPPVAQLDDSALVALFQIAGLPVGEVDVYTAENDPNKLLGRPNQYIAKVSWHDTRLPAPANPQQIEVSDGGGIEIWPDAAGAKGRMDYIQNLAKSLPLAVEYDYVNGPIILRLSKDLTPDQAAAYKQVFDTIPTP